MGEFSQLVWLIIAVVFFAVEALTYGLVSIWFALGAVVTMIAAFLGVDDIIWQLVVFVVSSAFFLLFTRRFFKKYLVRKTEKTNVDSIVGAQGIVTETIDNIRGTGAVNVAGKVWSARSQSGAVIPVHCCVDVLEIQGVKLIVRQASEIKTDTK